MIYKCQDGCCRGIECDGYDYVRQPNDLSTVELVVDDVIGKYGATKHKPFWEPSTVENELRAELESIIIPQDSLM